MRTSSLMLMATEKDILNNTEIDCFII